MLTLETGVQVECHVIHANMAMLLDVPHIVPVLEHLRERDGRATAASLSAELFLPGPLCESLLASCVKDELARETGGEYYTIAPDGTDALRSGKVLAGREGMWKVYIARHESLTENAAVVRIEDGAREAGYMLWIKDRQPRAERLDAAIRALEGARLCPALGEAREAFVRGIHGFEKQIEPDISLKLRMILDRDGARTVLLPSRIEDDARRGRRAPPLPREAPLTCTPVTIDEAMDALLDGESGMEWDAENARIAADYDGLSDTERYDMQKTMRLEDVTVGEMEFETASVTADIFPRSEADAQRWARHLFKKMATDYVTRKEYERLSRAIDDRLAGFDTGLGERASHVPDEGGGRPSARGHTRLFWLVRAMEDWDL